MQGAQRRPFKILPIRHKQLIKCKAIAVTLFTNYLVLFKYTVRFLKAKLQASIVGFSVKRYATQVQISVNHGRTYLVGVKGEASHAHAG